MRQPAAGFGRGDQLGHRGVERGRLLAGDGVAGARNDAAAPRSAPCASRTRCRRRTTRPRRRRSPAAAARTSSGPLPSPTASAAWPADCSMISAWPCARMLAQHPDEFGIAARVLVLVRLPRRRRRHSARRRPPWSPSANILPVSREAALASSTSCRIGARAVAAAGRRHRDAALGIMDADMQRGRRAHRMADDMRLVDPRAHPSPR